MATLKAIVKSRTRNGMYNVYIRITQNRQFAYVRTSWMVNDKGLSDDKKDIIDPFVIQQTSILIEKFYNMLNQVDASTWSANEVLTYVTDYGKDLSFSDYARAHIEKLIKRGQELHVTISGLCNIWKDSLGQTISCFHVLLLLSLTDG